ncbi:MAG: ADP-ribosylglycohydrolase family protein [Anaerolineae bacterium]|nr:ADP-ribosylglycohydrolase family protein [Anaerolineae bacterium]
MRNRDKALGAYLGAAIGDAMGGPVEGSHARRIQRLVGEIKGLIPYQKPYSLNDPQPGYALRPNAGAITDDTFIRVDFTRFFLATKPPRTPDGLVQWLLANADFSGWWPPIIEALYRVERGEVSAEEGGLTFFQGGGIGWWTPVGILHAGNPDGAAAEVRNLSRIWKAPLEQDVLAAVQAGVAEGMREGATVESVVEAILAPCGPLACKLFERAIAIGRKARNVDDLVAGLYSVALMPELERRHIEEPPRARDAELPPVITPLQDSDEKYMSSFFAEQAPFALAAFIYAKGDPQIAIPACVMLGRDCDSTATTVGSWVGALHGESGLPREWVATVCEVNRPDVDLRDMAERLYQLPN